MPAQTSGLLISEDDLIVGFWDTLFLGTRVGRCANKEFPPIGLMLGQNPDDLVDLNLGCPGCACEVSSHMCYACDCAIKDAFYFDGFPQ